MLYEDKVLTARQVIFVALEMLDSGQYELGHLATSVQDVIRRGRITRETALQLAAEANEAATVGRALRPHATCRRSSRSPRRFASEFASLATRTTCPTSRRSSRSTTSASSTRSTSIAIADDVRAWGNKAVRSQAGATCPI